MLKSVMGIAAGAALVLAFGARPARAMPDNLVVEAHVPFSFQVNGQTMPAGDYKIKSASFDEQNVLEIRNTAGHGPNEFVLTVPQEPRPDVQHAKMLFDKIGDLRFLRSILIPGETGAHLPAGRTELQAARAENGRSTAGQS